MKYHVIHDAQGNIISMTPSNASGPSSVPSRTHGNQSSAELELPAGLPSGTSTQAGATAGHAGPDLKELVKRLRVDVAAQKLVPKS